MVQRKWWLDKIKSAWEKHSVIWLSGVRRVGKTYLCKSIPDAEYFDCELPRIRKMMEDPQSFLSDHKGKTIVLDEIHRLENPSEILKIAADHYPGNKIIATGSSPLGASAKFRDTLTGRKSEIWLTPIIEEDMKDFGNSDLTHRFLFGGLPPFFLSKTLPEKDYQEWMDAYWTKDIQELFRLEKRFSFLKFIELLFFQSGAVFEATRFSRSCEVTRTTISNYLSVLEATYLVTVIRPFSSHKPTEIISAPKVYAFDTGFICYFSGWQELRREDKGYLIEHCVLNEMCANLQTRKICYWRDKRGHEIDFIIIDRNKHLSAIECKWSTNDFDPKNIIAFRRQYPLGENYLVANDVDRPFTKKYRETSIKFMSLNTLIKTICSNSESF